MSSRAATGSDSKVAARAAALASLGAAVIHFAATPAHWRDWMPSGLFFATIAVFQLLWAILVWTRPPVLLLAAGMVVNATTAALWVWAHTAGAPLGPNAGATEAVSAAGICVLLLECYVVMGAAWAWYRRDQPESVSSFASAAVLLGANTVVVAAVAAGVFSGLQGHDHHHSPIEAEGEPAVVHKEHGDAHGARGVPAVPLDVRTAKTPAPASPAPMPAADHDDHSGDHHGE
jgi:hypothetical protein